MRGTLSDRDAKCPFFCAHLRQSIICEGPIPDSRAKINFATTRGKEIQYKTFCCSRYTYCEMYSVTLQKYIEEEGNKDDG